MPSHNPRFKEEGMKKKDKTPSAKTLRGREDATKIDGLYWGVINTRLGALVAIYDRRDYPHGLPVVNDESFSVVELEIREVKPSPKKRGVK